MKLLIEEKGGSLSVPFQVPGELLMKLFSLILKFWTLNEQGLKQFLNAMPEQPLRDVLKNRYLHVVDNQTPFEKLKKKDLIQGFSILLWDRFPDRVPLMKLEGVFLFGWQGSLEWFLNRRSSSITKMETLNAFLQQANANFWKAFNEDYGKQWPESWPITLIQLFKLYKKTGKEIIATIIRQSLWENDLMKIERAINCLYHGKNLNSAEELELVYMLYTCSVRNVFALKNLAMLDTELFFLKKEMSRFWYLRTGNNVTEQEAFIAIFCACSENLQLIQLAKTWNCQANYQIGLQQCVALVATPTFFDRAMKVLGKNHYSKDLSGKITFGPRLRFYRATEANQRTKIAIIRFLEEGKLLFKPLSEKEKIFVYHMLHYTKLSPAQGIMLAANCQTPQFKRRWLDQIGEPTDQELAQNPLILKALTVRKKFLPDWNLNETLEFATKDPQAMRYGAVLGLVEIRREKNRRFRQQAYPHFPRLQGMYWTKTVNEAKTCGNFVNSVFKYNLPDLSTNATELTTGLGLTANDKIWETFCSQIEVIPYFILFVRIKEKKVLNRLATYQLCQEPKYDSLNPLHLKVAKHCSKKSFQEVIFYLKRYHVLKNGEVRKPLLTWPQ